MNLTTTRDFLCSPPCLTDARFPWYWSACLLLWYLSSSDLWIIPASGPAESLCILVYLMLTLQLEIALKRFLNAVGKYVCVYKCQRMLWILSGTYQNLCLWRDYLHAWQCNCTVIGTGIKLIIFQEKKNLCA